MLTKIKISLSGLNLLNDGWYLIHQNLVEFMRLPMDVTGHDPKDKSLGGARRTIMLQLVGDSLFYFDVNGQRKKLKITKANFIRSLNTGEPVYLGNSAEDLNIARLYRLATEWQQGKDTEHVLEMLRKFSVPRFQKSTSAKLYRGIALSDADYGELLFKRPIKLKPREACSFTRSKSVATGFAETQRRGLVYAKAIDASDVLFNFDAFMRYLNKRYPELQGIGNDFNESEILVRSTSPEMVQVDGSDVVKLYSNEFKRWF